MYCKINLNFQILDTTPSAHNKDQEATTQGPNGGEEGGQDTDKPGNLMTRKSLQLSNFTLEGAGSQVPFGEVDQSSTQAPASSSPEGEQSSSSLPSESATIESTTVEEGSGVTTDQSETTSSQQSEGEAKESEQGSSTNAPDSEGSSTPQSGSEDDQSTTTPSSESEVGSSTVQGQEGESSSSTSPGDIHKRFIPGPRVNFGVKMSISIITHFESMMKFALSLK